MERELYFSQTEACKFFHISIKRFKQVITDNNLTVVNRKITLHTESGEPYEVTTIYVLQIEFTKALFGLEKK
jgi:hypothetical protein